MTAAVLGLGLSPEVFGVVTDKLAEYYVRTKRGVIKK
jgi:hypothetical protein